jgi:hypothetical protein
MRRAGICIVAGALLALPAGPSQAERPLAARGLASAISTRATPTKLASGHATTITGTLAGPASPVAGELLELQADPSPYGRFVNAAHTVTGAGGRYRFAPVRVYRDTRFRVADVWMRGRTGPTVQVVVQAPAYPPSKRVIAAARYLSGRAGTNAFAVIDDDDRLAGVNLHRRFHSASVVKAMLLVAYLRRLAYQHRPLDGASQALLYPMIHSSDNNAASTVLAIVGGAALARVASDAQMDDFEASRGWWGFTEVSAADLVRFFVRQDAMIPGRFDGYARWLLSTIEPSESWGIPAIARPEFQVFFKGGWLPKSEGLVNQVGRLERPGIVFALAVLTTHDPSMAYGEQTIQGVTARLLGRAG